jgi:hypothetical protein
MEGKREVKGRREERVFLPGKESLKVTSQAARDVAVVRKEGGGIREGRGQRRIKVWEEG